MSLKGNSFGYQVSIRQRPRYRTEFVCSAPKEGTTHAKAAFALPFEECISVGGKWMLLLQSIGSRLGKVLAKLNRKFSHSHLDSFFLNEHVNHQLHPLP